MTEKNLGTNENSSCICCLEETDNFNCDKSIETIYLNLIEEAPENLETNLKICEKCTVELTNFANFKLKCLKSKAILADLKTLNCPSPAVSEEFLPSEPLPKTDIPKDERKIRTICSICQFSTFKLRDHIVEYHLVSHSKNRLFCKVCNESTSNINSLVRHFQRSHTTFEEPKRCPNCLSTFSDHKSLESHIGTVHQSTECEFCGKLLKNSYKEFHIKTIHEGFKGCFKCKIWFSDSEQFDRHKEIDRAKEKTKDKLVCAECGYETIHQTSMRVHQSKQ